MNGPHGGWLLSTIRAEREKILKKAVVTGEELQTVLVEIEARPHSRPLTFVFSEDIEEPLTPLHVVRWRRIALLERLKEHFWTRWKINIFLN